MVREAAEFRFVCWFCERNWFRTVIVVAMVSLLWVFLLTCTCCTADSRFPKVFINFVFHSDIFISTHGWWRVSCRRVPAGQMAWGGGRTLWRSTQQFVFLVWNMHMRGRWIKTRTPHQHCLLKTIKSRLFCPRQWRWFTDFNITCVWCCSSSGLDDTCSCLPAPPRPVMQPKPGQTRQLLLTCPRCAAQPLCAALTAREGVKE